MNEMPQTQKLSPAEKIGYGPGDFGSNVGTQQHAASVGPRAWAMAALLVSAFWAVPVAAQIRPIGLTALPGKKVPFQSHNQKVVANAGGTFLTLHGGLVMRSNDGGRSFAKIYNVNNSGLKPPTVETDENANIYVIYPEVKHRRTQFLKFSPDNGYAAPVVSRAYKEASSASKFASVHDPRRKRFYHATQSGHLLTIDTSGKLLRSQHVYAGGKKARSSYPHLFLGTDGVLHFAVTAADENDRIPYETIRYLKSTDGGETWRSMDGREVKTPTSCDADGPSTMINLTDEVPYNTWLANMHVKNGKAHFMYLTRNPGDAGKPGEPKKIAERQHYMRFDAATGRREIDSWTDFPQGKWSGKELHIHSESGVFASAPGFPKGPLFAVSTQGGGKLVALVSYDDGATWYDHAASKHLGMVTAVGGARAVTRNGYVIGSFACATPKWATTYFFKFNGRPAAGRR